MEEFKIVGKLDLNKLAYLKNIIVTDKVVLTNERKEHVDVKHQGNYELIKDNLKDLIYNPDYILEDIKNKKTIIILKEIIEQNRKTKIIIKLATNRKEKRFNSIITLWNIRDRDYNKTITKNKIIYKRLDRV